MMTKGIYTTTLIRKGDKSSNACLMEIFITSGGVYKDRKSYITLGIARDIAMKMIIGAQCNYDLSSPPVNNEIYWLRSDIPSDFNSYKKWNIKTRKTTTINIFTEISSLSEKLSSALYNYEIDSTT